MSCRPQELDAALSDQELNVQVARHVMGWQTASDAPGAIDARAEAKGEFVPFIAWIEHRDAYVAFRTRESVIKDWHAWSPATRIADAWEALLKSGLSFSLKRHHHFNEYEVIINGRAPGGGPYLPKGVDPRAERAICLAALEEARGRQPRKVT